MPISLNPLIGRTMSSRLGFYRRISLTGGRISDTCQIEPWFELPRVQNQARARIRCLLCQRQCLSSGTAAGHIKGEVHQRNVRVYTIQFGAFKDSRCDNPLHHMYEVIGVSLPARPCPQLPEGKALPPKPRPRVPTPAPAPTLKKTPPPCRGSHPFEMPEGHQNYNFSNTPVDINKRQVDGQLRFTDGYINAVLVGILGLPARFNIRVLRQMCMCEALRGHPDKEGEGRAQDLLILEWSVMQARYDLVMSWVELSTTLPSGSDNKGYRSIPESNLCVPSGSTYNSCC